MPRRKISSPGAARVPAVTGDIPAARSPAARDHELLLLPAGYDDGVRHDELLCSRLCDDPAPW